MSKLNILVAYPYMKPDVIDLLNKNQNDIRFLLDSGAFTAWRAGKSIQIDDYCKFIESLPFKPWRYFTLDVIGDPEKSFKNYELMRSRGFNPIPIFTRGEDIKMIDKYYETSDVVGIGGLVGTQGNKGFVKGIMKVVGKRKVHWLGFTGDNFIKHYKPYSVDSSSWESGAQYASFKMYDHDGTSIVIKKSMFKTRPSRKVLKLVKKYGIDEKEIGFNKNWAGGESIPRFSAAKSSIVQQQFYEKIDVKVFAAATTKQAIFLLIKAKIYWENYENTSRIIGRDGLNNCAGVGEATT